MKTEPETKKPKSRLHKEDLSPFFQKHEWLVPIVGVLLIVVSPILFPAIVLYSNRDHLAALWDDAIEGIKYRRSKSGNH